MIELIDIEKKFQTKHSLFSVLKKINLKIREGEIFGILGKSGAGKSTLLHCINLLEKPTSGQVIVNGVDLTSLGDQNLRKARKKIGMIFQHFHLLNSATVWKNIALPLECDGMSKENIQSRVEELLQVTGLQDKAMCYPGQLSGGQKQRVAIARAIATHPTVLLCDEPTSALDEETTKSILNLLKKINEDLRMTIVMITHEKSIAQNFCQRCALIENGVIK